MPSGSYSVNDVIPAGMSLSAPSRGRQRDQGVSVVWTDLPSLTPLTTTVLTLQLRLDDVTLPSYVNTAEISADSADDYSTPADPVTDDDSRPDDDTTNDDVIDTDDVDIDVLFGDEDDHDIAALDMSLVLAANSANSADPDDPRSQPCTAGHDRVWIHLAAPARHDSHPGRSGDRAPRPSTAESLIRIVRRWKLGRGSCMNLADRASFVAYVATPLAQGG